MSIHPSLKCFSMPFCFLQFSYATLSFFFAFCSVFTQGEAGGSHQPRAAFWDGKCDSRDIFCGGFDDAETRYFAVLGLCLWMGKVVLNGHLISRLRASAYSAPCFPFGKARCSGRPIFPKQSTGLFSPKRSTSRAAPLRVNPRGEARGSHPLGAVFWDGECDSRDNFLRKLGRGALLRRGFVYNI